MKGKESLLPSPVGLSLSVIAYSASPLLNIREGPSTWLVRPSPQNPYSKMSQIIRRILALKLIFLSVIILVNAAGECYFPTGDLARRDTSCYTDGGASHCCGPNAMCLTNGLCLAVAAPFSLSRGSCTDKAWGPSCPSICGESFCQRKTPITLRLR